MTSGAQPGPLINGAVKNRGLCDGLAADRILEPSKNCDHRMYVVVLTISRRGWTKLRYRPLLAPSPRLCRFASVRVARDANSEVVVADLRH